MKTIKAHYVDIEKERIFPAELQIKDGKIFSIKEIEEKVKHYVLPGYIDAHIHIESSMMTPYRFSSLAIKHGTIATVSDPHEIANVNGVQGVEYMLESARHTPFHFYFGAPSCVPATPFEHSGAVLNASEVEKLIEREDIFYLSEMMNFPGVIHEDVEVLAKIEAAKKWNKPIDGHAPQLLGEDLKKYISASISTDHECTTLEEAKEKLSLGMKILIREGSAAKNYEALHLLITEYSEKLMFCSDDKHPDDLVKGHINLLVKRSLDLGYDFYKVLRIACFNPIDHYGLKVGKVKEGDPANFQLVDSIEDLNVLEVYLEGEPIVKNGKVLIKEHQEEPLNNFQLEDFERSALEVAVDKEGSHFRIIEAIDGELLTREIVKQYDTNLETIPIDVEKDILKIVVVNRYQKHSMPAVAFIKGIGIKKGAIGSCIAHDSHNIVVVGADDDSIIKVVEKMIAQKGGIAVADANDNFCQGLELNIGGILSTESPLKIAKEYENLDQIAKKWGSTLEAPFMTLSFMALPVIPKLKITDMGLFDVDQFKKVEVLFK